MAGDPRTCQRCNAVLSRYNSGSRCSACVRASPGPSVPPSLWELAPVRQALVAEDVGSVLMSARQALGISQAELAHLLTDDLVAFSQAKVSRIEAGAAIRDIEDRRRISDVLGIPPELLGLASRQSFTRASLSL